MSACLSRCLSNRVDETAQGTLQNEGSHDYRQACVNCCTRTSTRASTSKFPVVTNILYEYSESYNTQNLGHYRYKTFCCKTKSTMSGMY